MTNTLNIFFNTPVLTKTPLCLRSLASSTSLANACTISFTIKVGPLVFDPRTKALCLAYWVADNHQPGTPVPFEAVQKLRRSFDVETSITVRGSRPETVKKGDPGFWHRNSSNKQPRNTRREPVSCDLFWHIVLAFIVKKRLRPEVCAREVSQRY